MMLPRKPLRVSLRRWKPCWALALESPVDAIYGETRARLERAGHSIGANDLFTAAQALALGHTIVTDGEREFSRVPDLRIENWLR
jgi:tRNA(fMet)-specific endonuclease VapC